MNKIFQSILTLIEESLHLTEEEKKPILKSIIDADKVLEITSFKLDRAEKVKRTMAILLEETIEELEQKRKAVEEQNKELEIEAALEKVRNRTLLMKDSSELNEAVAVFFQQFKLLKLLPHEARTYFCHINADAEVAEVWMTHADGTVMNTSHQTPLTKSSSLLNYYEAWKRKEPILVRNYSGDALTEYLQFLSTLPHVKADKDYHHLFSSPPEKIVMTDANFLHGNIGIMTFEPLTHDALDILIRFAKIFEFTYTRFLDLQKAEAQAREAQIELALERVRARTMAMQKSSELAEASSLLFNQLKLLGIYTYSSGFTIWDVKNDKLVSWMCNADGSMNPPFIMPIADEAWHHAQYNSWKNREDFITKDFNGEEMRSHFQYLQSFPLLDDAFKKSIAAGHAMPQRQVHNVVNFSHGNLLFITLQPCPEAHDVFKRFAKVFDQTYIRFLDLQKAEAQAREAQIELGLERVRARAMAMQNSEELKELIGTVFTELTKLDLLLVGCVIIIFDPLTKSSRWWMVNSETPAEPLSFFIKYHESLPYLEFIKAWEERQLRWEYVLKGDTKKEWDNVLFSETELANIPAEAIAGMRTPERILLSTSFNSFGCLNVGTIEPLTVEQFDMLLRFAKVFDLTYTRFNDLQKAEAQAREAQIEASFERIRASALAMQTSYEFLGVVKTLYEQINTLGQKELEATIIQFYHIEKGFIISWNALNTEGLTVDNITLGHTHIPFDACELTLEWLNAYKSTQDDYTIVAKGEKLKEWLLLLIKMSPEVKTRFGDSLPQISHYHFSKFSEGALSMVSQKPFSDESKYLLKRAASAFDLAYKRYLDLQLKEEQSLKLAQEKLRLEAALKELHATQNQLIQKEKLASLGELTAGIAHEIQNPLNFVNNFSELSVDLVKDLKEEIDKPTQDKEYIGELFDDLSQNQEKINHHGKRASSIVKGMLEHSRASTGVKDLTDINKLTDEYLRLSYHGLRAKDNSFNAYYELIIDENLPKIEVIPQDIGRVLLNLINNAFYAINEKNKPNISDAANGGIEGVSFKPTVEISTQFIDNQIIIKVKDNGIGMSEATKAKVFQPFFTTKPAGQGTGLGLSLAYDIVTKGHGGTLEVESTEGVSSEFIIRLPMN